MSKRKLNLQLFAVSNFIPQIWSAQLLQSLKNTLIFGQEGIINKNYQGEISQYGDTVKINTLGTVTVGNYTRNTDMTDPQTLSGTQQTLTIDQSKYFNFQIDDLDKAQTNPKLMQQAMVEASYALRNTCDAFIAATMAAGAKSSNVIGTAASPIKLTAADVINYFVDLQVKLDDENVPEQGRFVVIPPVVYGLIEKSDKFQYTEGNMTQVVRNGQVGRLAGFDVIKANTVPKAKGTGSGNPDYYKIIAGHSIATTFAEQINDVEGYRMEKRFADAVKGLHLYGAKVVRPEALAVLNAMV